MSRGGGRGGRRQVGAQVGLPRQGDPRERGRHRVLPRQLLGPHPSGSLLLQLSPGNTGLWTIASRVYRESLKKPSQIA